MRAPPDCEMAGDGRSDSSLGLVAFFMFFETTRKVAVQVMLVPIADVTRVLPPQAVMPLS